MFRAVEAACAEKVSDFTFLSLHIFLEHFWIPKTAQSVSSCRLAHKHLLLIFLAACRKHWFCSAVEEVDMFSLVLDQTLLYYICVKDEITFTLLDRKRVREMNTPSFITQCFKNGF